MHGVHGPERSLLERTSAISNQSSLQNTHACISYYRSCDTRHICILICDVLLHCQATSKQNVHHKCLRRSRKHSDRHQGSRTHKNAVSSLRRSPGPWLNIWTHVISSQCDRGNLVIPREPGRFTFVKMNLTKPESQWGIPFSLAQTRKPISCKFEYVSCRGKSPRIIVGRNSTNSQRKAKCADLFPDESNILAR